MKPPPGTPPNAKAAYFEVLEGLVYPFREQALIHWERAAKSSTVSGFWSRIARERLAGITVPDC